MSVGNAYSERLRAPKEWQLVVLFALLVVLSPLSLSGWLPTLVAAPGR